MQPPAPKGATTHHEEDRRLLVAVVGGAGGEREVGGGRRGGAGGRRRVVGGGVGAGGGAEAVPGLLALDNLLVDVGHLLHALGVVHRGDDEEEVPAAVGQLSRGGEGVQAGAVHDVELDEL